MCVFPAIGETHTHTHTHTHIHTHIHTPEPYALTHTNTVFPYNRMCSFTMECKENKTYALTPTNLFHAGVSQNSSNFTIEYVLLL